MCSAENWEAGSDKWPSGTKAYSPQSVMLPLLPSFSPLLVKELAIRSRSAIPLALEYCMPHSRTQHTRNTEKPIMAATRTPPTNAKRRSLGSSSLFSVIHSQKRPHGLLRIISNERTKATMPINVAQNRIASQSNICHANNKPVIYCSAASNYTAFS